MSGTESGITTENADFVVTNWPRAAIGVQMLADRLVEEKGAFAPEGCIDPGIFMQELLDKRSIGELTTKRIEE